MGKKVFANGMEIAHKAGSNKVTAAFPDVCLSPPGPPAGPVPVPYADTSNAGDLEGGSKDVKIGGQPVSLHRQSYYASSPLGNEAATRNFGASLLTASIKGKTCFQAASMNVIFEGAPVNRHLDLATSNHGSEPPGTPPIPGMESMNGGAGKDGEVEGPKCPCCRAAAHPNQIGPDGKLSEVVTQDAYYASKVEPFVERRTQMEAMVVSGKLPAWASTPGRDPNPRYNGLPTKDIIIGKGKDAAKSLHELQELVKANPGCSNLHRPPDVDCGTHLRPNGQALVARRKLFDPVRKKYLLAFRKKNPHLTQVTQHSPVGHMTPLDAGGCPVSSDNLIPLPVLEGPCAQIETLQTKVQSF
jgi:hypothetical protein